MAAMTFILVLLFKYGVRALFFLLCLEHMLQQLLHVQLDMTDPLLPVQCFKFIYAYMAFAVFDIFFLITGIVMIEVITVSCL